MPPPNSDISGMREQILVNARFLYPSQTNLDIILCLDYSTHDFTAKLIRSDLSNIIMISPLETSEHTAMQQLLYMISGDLNERIDGMVDEVKRQRREEKKQREEAVKREEAMKREEDGENMGS